MVKIKRIKKYFFTLIIAVLTMVITASLSVSAAVTEIPAGANEDVKFTMSNIAFGGVGQKSSFAFKFTGLNKYEDIDLKNLNVYFQSEDTAMYAITTMKYSLTDNKASVYNAVFKSMPKENDKIIFKNKTTVITCTIGSGLVFSAAPPNPTITVKGVGASVVFNVTADVGGTLYFTEGVEDPTKEVLVYKNVQSFDLTTAKSAIKMSDLSSELQTFALEKGYIKVYYKNSVKYGEQTTVPITISFAKGVMSPTPTATVNAANQTVTIKAKGLDKTWEIYSYNIYWDMSLEYSDSYKIPSDKIDFSKSGTAVINFNDIRGEDDYSEEFAFTVKKPDCYQSNASNIVYNFSDYEDEYLYAYGYNYVGPNDLIIIEANLPDAAKILVFAIPKDDDDSFSNIACEQFDANGKYYNENGQYVVSPYYTGLSVKISPNKTATIKTNLEQFSSSELLLYAVFPKVTEEGEKGYFADEVFVEDYYFGIELAVDVYKGEKSMTVVMTNTLPGYKYSLYNSVTGAVKTVTASDYITVISGIKYSQGFDLISVSHSTLPPLERLPLSTGNFYWYQDEAIAS